MHLHQLVVAVQKTDNSTLRETHLYSGAAVSNTTNFSTLHKKSIVHLPFGSEYSLFFKNMSSERAVVGVEIDGTDALGGNKLVVDGKSTARLERFVLDGNLDKGRKFKFVALDSPDVQNPTADKNGVVRITAQWETPRPTIRIIPAVVRQWSFSPPLTPPIDRPMFDIWCGDTHTSGAVPCSSTLFVGNTVMEQGMACDCAPVSQKGATVEGAESVQKFQYTFTEDLTGPEVVMEFQIYAPAPVVPTPTRQARVDTQRYCTQCREPLEARDRFCGSCGAPVTKR